MPSRMERSLRHVAMVAKFLDLNNLGPVNMTGKKTKKLVRYDFPMQDCTQKQNGSPFFFPSFDDANGRLCQERLLKSKTFPTIVT